MSSCRRQEQNDYGWERVNRVRPTCRMIQGKTVVDDVIMTQAKGVETKGGDAIIPDKKDGIN